MLQSPQPEERYVGVSIRMLPESLAEQVREAVKVLEEQERGVIKVVYEDWPAEHKDFVEVFWVAGSSETPEFRGINYRESGKHKMGYCVSFSSLQQHRHPTMKMAKEILKKFGWDEKSDDLVDIESCTARLHGLPKDLPRK